MSLEIVRDETGFQFSLDNEGDVVIDIGGDDEDSRRFVSWNEWDQIVDWLRKKRYEFDRKASAE